MENNGIHKNPTEQFYSQENRLSLSQKEHNYNIFWGKNTV